jgi:hypothetical protein
MVKTTKSLVVVASFFALSLGASVPCRADTVVGLGAAGNFAVLGLDDSTSGTAINASNVTINGNVGVSHLSTLSNMAPSTINGNVYFQDTGSVSGPGTFNGSLIQQSMTQAVADAFAANTGNAALTPTQTFSGDLTSAKTFTGSGGLNVINISGGINLNNANLTLSGGKNDIFVVNVSGNLSLTGTASLLVSGTPISNVLYNFTGGSASKHGSFDTHVGDLVQGTTLAPYYNMNLDGTWEGGLIGGPLNIGLLSNASVTQNPFSPGVPEPTSLLAMTVTGGLFLGGYLRRRRAAA